MNTPGTGGGRKGPPPCTSPAASAGGSNVYPLHELHGPPEPPPAPHRPSKALRIAAAAAIRQVIQQHHSELKQKARQWAAQPPKVHRFHGTEVVAVQCERHVQCAFLFAGVQLRDVYFRNSDCLDP
jgi:hypothetical protein